jgi:RNA methyltransferase, TrmH family
MLGKSKIKYIQSLGQKKPRDNEGVFIAEGPKIIDELLSSGNVFIREIYGTKQWIDEYGAMRHKPGRNNIAITEITDDELGKISQLTTPNQVLAIVKKSAVPSFHAKDAVTLVLDALQDPGNVGTIIRIADWFGISQIVCSRDCADVYNPKVVQSTMGSIARVHVLYTDLPSWLEAQGAIRIYAAALKGKDIATMEKIKEGIIVIGNESKGVSNEIMGLAEEKITISKKGKAESLNAAVATGIILSHLI